MKKNVLVVDNNPVILKSMTNLLEKKGCQVQVADDGLTALDILESYVPDVIFVDLVMPNISGDKLCRIIRRMPELKGVYLVILSAISAEEEVDIIEFGANACIAKGPFNKMAQHILFAMDQSNWKNIVRYAQDSDERSRVRMIMNMVEPGSDLDVPDPYWDDNGFEQVFHMLEEACDKILEEFSMAGVGSEK